MHWVRRYKYSRAAFTQFDMRQTRGALYYGPTHKLGTVSRVKRCGDATALDG